MKTETKKLDGCQVELKVSLEADEIQVVVKDVEKTFLREAALPGFRKGKVPLAMIRQKFAAGLRESIIRDMIQKYNGDAFKAAKLEIVNLTNVTDAKYDETSGEFTEVVEVKPTFKLPTYKGLKVSQKDTTVSEEAVQEQIQRMREAYAKYEDAKEGDTAAAGDYVQLDYEGKVGDKKILEINAEARIVGEGKGFWTLLQEGHFLPEILEAVKGMKIGETKEGVKAKFDKETAPEGLKGAKAVYTVKLVGMRHRILPTDAELCEKTKSESIDKIVSTMREGMEKAAVDEESRRREEEAIEMLLKKVDFDVPQSQVATAQNNYLRALSERAQYSGVDVSYFEKNKDKIRKDAEETATKQVRLWYLIEAIAEAEKIEAKDEERGKKVMEFILANAKK